MKMINKLLVLIGVILMILGIINALVPGPLFGLTNSVIKYFNIAICFFVLAISCKLICTKE